MKRWMTLLAGALLVASMIWIVAPGTASAHVRQRPTTPTGLKAFPLSATELGLLWNTQAGVTEFAVFRDGMEISTTTHTAVIDSTVQPATTYRYRVEAFNAAGHSGLSSALKVTTPPASPPPPVSFVQQSSVSTKTVTISEPAQAGDLLVLIASLYTGATNHISAISPDYWHEGSDANVAGHNSDGELWYAIAQGGETSFTVATGASRVALDFMEFNGPNLNSTQLITQYADSNRGTTASASTASATETGTGTLEVGFVASHGSNLPVTGPADWTNFAQEPTPPAPYVGLVTGYVTGTIDSTTAARYSTTLAQAQYWSAGIAIFSGD